MQKQIVYLGLGSNIGDRLKYLQGAIDELSGLDGVVVCRVSPVYQTEPVGYEAQDDFYNLVVQVETTLNPMMLLGKIVEVEEKLGRTRTAHKGPRTIDIDILLYGDEVIEEYRLIVPHPRMRLREFVLRPLADLDPEVRIPTVNISVSEALSEVEGEKRVVLIPETIEIRKSVNE